MLSKMEKKLLFLIYFQWGGLVFELGCLKCGYMILEVNGQSLWGMEYCDVVKIIVEVFCDLFIN